VVERPHREISVWRYGNCGFALAHVPAAL